MQLKTAIPHCYYSLADAGKNKDAKNDLFLKYVRAYAEKIHPGYEFLSVKNGQAILERREGDNGGTV
ncbi:hypothetical protein [Terribacillus saccharophilus]|uniref:hypothetical protein n=1 Tax=Terribacillus saccharophilus TaxID=361277 RepID=UPI000BDCA303|nr:hypothetical protein [Terribacillus saccharophilus]PAF19723.1 hypothetical protein CHH51_01280 [Terribacillus saccharophilus]